jgi:hypothetical protein
MRLSEAIRLGAMVTSPLKGAFTSVDGSACAIGAALIAVGQLKAGTPSYGAHHCKEAAERLWPEFYGQPQIACPVCGAQKRFLVAHINNAHDWTREQIADWVESIETAQESVIENADQAAEHVSVTVPSAAQKD